MVIRDEHSGIEALRSNDVDGIETPQRPARQEASLPMHDSVDFRELDPVQEFRHVLLSQVDPSRETTELGLQQAARNDRRPTNDEVVQELGQCRRLRLIDEKLGGG